MQAQLLFNMTVQSVQQIKWQPGWNPENETAKAIYAACNSCSQQLTIHTATVTSRVQTNNKQRRNLSAHTQVVDTQVVHAHVHSITSSDYTL